MKKIKLLFILFTTLIFFNANAQQHSVSGSVTDSSGGALPNVTVNVKGGGIKGQAEAISLGIARALVKNDETVKPVLKTENLLTRDSRMVERKKFGKKKARKSF